MEMMKRKVFRDFMTKSAAFLHEMGCDWDPVKKLTKETQQPRLSVPEINQPICSVLQIV